MLNRITSTLNKLKRDESGASAIEYAVMAAILVGVLILAIGFLDLDGIFTSINTAIDGAA